MISDIELLIDMYVCPFQFITKTRVKDLLSKARVDLSSHELAIEVPLHLSRSCTNIYAVYVTHAGYSQGYYLFKDGKLLYNNCKPLWFFDIRDRHHSFPAMNDSFVMIELRLGRSNIYFLYDLKTGEYRENNINSYLRTNGVTLSFHINDTKRLMIDCYSDAFVDECIPKKLEVLEDIFSGIHIKIERTEQVKGRKKTLNSINYHESGSIITIWTYDGGYDIKHGDNIIFQPGDWSSEDETHKSLDIVDLNGNKLSYSKVYEKNQDFLFSTPEVICLNEDTFVAESFDSLIIYNLTTRYLYIILDKGQSWGCQKDYVIVNNDKQFYCYKDGELVNVIQDDNVLGVRIA